MVVRGIIKGDTINFFFTLNEDMTNSKVRAEIWDKCGHSIKLATSNSGGTEGDIIFTNVTEGQFEVVVAKDLTDNFDGKSFIEIEEETESGEQYTICPQAQILFEEQRINWKEPS